MMQVILDTNVIVSAIMGSENCRLIVDFIVRKNAALCLSEEVLQEYDKVINYPRLKKIPNFSVEASLVLLRLSDFSINYKVTQKFNFIRDLPDNRFLELAAASSAQYLITGNTNDFTFKSFFETRIVSPADFCTEFNLKN
jgi:uncharacterized protein